jgi:predicted CXXCH cytochrome family protein
MDCIACHVVDPNGADKIVDMGNGSAIPQVWHADATGDLAGGNWAGIANGSSRNGHNVADLFAGGDSNGGTYGAPPGKFRDSTHGPSFGGSATPFADFTCAGSGGCHGTRSQALTGFTDANVVGTVDGPDFWNYTERKGIPAVSGAHHANFDGAKNADENYQAAPSVHSGAKVADGYRMIPGLKGYGNTVDRWQNVDANSHNEYFGVAGGLDNMTDATLGGSSCQICHVQGVVPGGSPRMNADSTIRVPNQSMSGFCATCHGVFHSVGTGVAALSDSVGKGGNGVSGAFQRHPSDYVIPATGEYAGYTSYKVSAPVARPSLATAASATVAPGTDMVMCLSCHKAHASDYDYMLRFDYAAMSAGNATTGLGEGCLACHTTKGLPKAD